MVGVVVQIQIDPLPLSGGYASLVFLWGGVERGGGGFCPPPFFPFFYFPPGPPISRQIVPSTQPTSNVSALMPAGHVPS